MLMNNEEPITGPYGIYGLWAKIFEYPQYETFNEFVLNAFRRFATEIPQVDGVMKPFADFVSGSSLNDIQELYLRTFDVQAITTLDIGFVLFGEDYKRGQLLVNLNREHEEAGNDCHTELADSLPNLLNLIHRMKNDEMRNEIASKLIIPAVVKMSSEFRLEKIEKKDKVYKKHMRTLIEVSDNYRTVYRTLLDGLLHFLKRDFEYDVNILNYFKDEKHHEDKLPETKAEPEPVRPPSFSNINYFVDFSDQIEIEMTIEK